MTLDSDFVRSHFGSSPWAPALFCTMGALTGRVLSLSFPRYPMSLRCWSALIVDVFKRSATLEMLTLKICNRRYGRFRGNNLAWVSRRLMQLDVAFCANRHGTQARSSWRWSRSSRSSTFWCMLLMLLEVVKLFQALSGLRPALHTSSLMLMLVVHRLFDTLHDVAHHALRLPGAAHPHKPPDGRALRCCSRMLIIFQVLLILPRRFSATIDSRAMLGMRCKFA